MAQAPNRYTLKGKLQIVMDGMETPIDLGDIEIPVRVDFNRPGRITDGGGIRGGGAVINISGAGPDDPAAMAAAVQRGLSNAAQLGIQRG